MMFTPSTMRRFLSAITFSTRPRLPRSLPVITTTLSFFRIGVSSRAIVSYQLPAASFQLEHFWSERNDFHELALAQLARHRAEHASADRFVLVVDEHGGVPIEADVAAVLAPLLLARAHDDRLHDLPLLDIAVRSRFLDRRRDDVAQPRVASGRSADRVDRRDLARAGVVGDVEDRTHLDHG